MAARDGLEPFFTRVGRVTGLPYRRPLTLGIRLQRLFVTPTRGYVGVADSPVAGLIDDLPGIRSLELEQGHVFLQQRWWRVGSPTQWYPTNRAANLGMRRLGNAGWNLMAMPRALNQRLGQSPLGSLGFGVAAGTGVGAAGYGGYKLGGYIYDHW